MKFLKNLRTNAEVKLINFQDPTNNGNFDKYSESTVFHLPEKLVGNQYLEVLRILVPHHILFPYLFLQNLRGTAYVQLINFEDTINKSDFDTFLI